MVAAFLAVLPALTPPAGDGEAAANTESAPAVPAFAATGDRRDIITRGDLRGRVDLRPLRGVPHVYALGPVAGLKGEVTIYDGTPAVATLDGAGAVVVDASPAALNREAIFLARGKVANWRAVPVPRVLSGLAAVEAFVRDAAAAAGRSLDAPFLFRIEGTADVEYHVIWKTGDAPHNKAEHKRSKRPFVARRAAVKIVGAWADEAGEGVYTHPGKRTHLHFLSADGTHSGHVDGITLTAGATLFLPE